MGVRVGSWHEEFSVGETEGSGLEREMKRRLKAHYSVLAPPSLAHLPASGHAFAFAFVCCAQPCG
eukprot:739972-Rhodomonas_salina.1